MFCNHPRSSGLHSHDSTCAPRRDLFDRFTVFNNSNRKHQMPGSHWHPEMIGSHLKQPLATVRRSSKPNGQRGHSSNARDDHSSSFIQEPKHSWATYMVTSKRWSLLLIKFPEIHFAIACPLQQIKQFVLRVHTNKPLMLTFPNVQVTHVRAPSSAQPHRCIQHVQQKTLIHLLQKPIQSIKTFKKKCLFPFFNKMKKTSGTHLSTLSSHPSHPCVGPCPCRRDRAGHLWGWAAMGSSSSGRAWGRLGGAVGSLPRRFSPNKKRGAI